MGLEFVDFGLFCGLLGIGGMEDRKGRGGVDCCGWITWLKLTGWLAWLARRGRRIDR